jgi:phage/plasmid-like protein (TIGR03299 family)
LIKQSKKKLIMAHKLFTDANGKTSFAAVGQKAWHGLGQYVENAMTAAQAIELGGLNYTVEKQPITINGGSVIPGYNATVRIDTNEPLGIVSEVYQIVQNHEAFEFFDAIVERGEAIYQTAGVLGKGEKIFITARLPEDILVNGEQVENYLLLTSGHDGRSAIQAGFTSVRVVCNNTLNAALRGLQNKVTIMHYSNAKENLKQAARVMGMASKYTKELDVIFNKMSEVKITDDKLRKYIETVMNPKREQISEEEFSQRFINQVDSIMDFSKTHHTQVTDGAKNTVWGAYNAISGYYGWLKNYDDQETKMKDIHFKNGAKRIENAFQIAVEMI